MSGTSRRNLGLIARHSGKCSHFITYTAKTIACRGVFAREPEASPIRSAFNDSCHPRQHHFSCLSGWWAILVILAGSFCPVFAADQQVAATLKNSVILVGANSANDAMAMAVPPGPLSLDLYLQVQRSIQTAKEVKPALSQTLAGNQQAVAMAVVQGQLTHTHFQAQSPPGEVVPAEMQIVGGGKVKPGASPLDMTLTPPQLINVRLCSKGSLHPGTTYKGVLFLTAEGQANRWDITLTTGGLGVLAVEPVGPIKFERWPWDGPSKQLGEFSFTLRDKSSGGPFHNVRVRFEPSGGAASKAITSNFSLDSLSFHEGKKPHLVPVDLERREGNDHQAGKPLGDPAVGKSQNNRTEQSQLREAQLQDQAKPSRKMIDVQRGGQKTIVAKVADLSPGEYAGTLKFASDESADDAADARLPLTFQVRDHFLVPLAVILFGSGIGWYTSKYVVARRKARQLNQQVQGLQVRARDLASHNLHRIGWEFPSEAFSGGLALIRVKLSQLGVLTSSGIPMLVRESEITQQVEDVRLRIAALERLRATRLQVQPEADNKPAAQLALGQVLRSARHLLEGPVFDENRQGEFEKLLQTATEWTLPDKREERYRDALNRRWKSPEIPSSSQVDAFKEPKVKEQLEALRKNCPDESAINEARLNKLSAYDENIAKLALLWRERDTTWAIDLANKCSEGVSIQELFEFVDNKLWSELRNEKKKLEIQLKNQSLEILPSQSSSEKCGRTAEQLQVVTAYDLVTIQLNSNAPGPKTERISRHPLLVLWKIMINRTDVWAKLRSIPTLIRTTEGDGLTLIQYFLKKGKVTVKAELQWRGESISIEDLSFDVKKNWDYSMFKIVYSGGGTEVVVFVIAAGFAIATAMVTQYDATFGSFSQYLTLFLWAAGAGASGNIFKQLGESGTPGGRADATLAAGK